MGRKVQKTLNLTLETAERLEQEQNQSGTVEVALQEYWDRWSNSNE